MADFLRHEEISARFLESGGVNFDAIGKFVSEIGSDLASRDEGIHGVALGRFNMIYCFLRPDDVDRVFGGLRNAGGLAEAIDVPARH